MEAQIRSYTDADVPAMTAIWNEVVESGVAFPQLEPLGTSDAAGFFKSQSHCGVAVDVAAGEVQGLYILHPNHIGRCGHIANASYAVASAARGSHIGARLVEDSLAAAKGLGFRILQFNAVVRTNAAARHLYKKLGFHELGTIPDGFLMKDGRFEDICLYYRPL